MNNFYSANDRAKLLALIDSTIIESQDNLVDTTNTVLVDALEECQVDLKAFTTALLKARNRHNTISEEL